MLLWAGQSVQQMLWGWTFSIAMLLWSGQSVHQHLLAGSHFSDVALGCTVTTATVVGWTFIIAMLLWAGQPVEQLLLAGQSL